MSICHMFSIKNANQAEAICSVLKSDLFAACAAVVCPSRFVDACEFDLCADTNSRYRSVYFCAAVAAYARECQMANVSVNWMADSRIQSYCQDAQYGQCTGGAAYSDCAPKCDQTCSQVANANQTCYERDCIAGCACPRDSYLDTSYSSKPQCVRKSECNCYDSESNGYLKPGSVVTRNCGNW